MNLCSSEQVLTRGMDASSVITRGFSLSLFFGDVLEGAYKEQEGSTPLMAHRETVLAQ